MPSPSDPRLVFVENRSVLKGFDAREGTDDEIVVRELVQNALDAGADQVDFTTTQVSVDLIPDIDGYRSAVAAIHPDLKETPPAIAALERIHKAVDAETVTVLLCSDNGTGLGHNEYRRLLSEAMSDKVGDSSAGKLGSVGVGHLTALNVSDMRYVLYASHGDKALFGGQAILAGQLHDGIHKVAHGALTTAENVDSFVGFEPQPADPETVPAWLKSPFVNGATVAILAYQPVGDDAGSPNGADPDADGGMLYDGHMHRIFDATAKHFMVALKDNKLSVSYSSDQITRAHCDLDEVRKRLKHHRHRRSATRSGYGSGKGAWEAWQTLTEGEVVPLDNGARLWFRPTPGELTKVTVFRNGMRITDNAPHLRSGDFAGCNAFNAVLDADGELAVAIKECETDSHLDIKLRQAPKASGQKARDGLKQVKAVLRDRAGEQNTQEWTPEVLRMFSAGNDRHHKIKPAPPKPQPPNPHVEQESLLEVDFEGTAPPAPAPGPGPGPSPGPDPAPRPPKPRAWRQGNTAGIRHSLAPATKTEAVVGWDFTKNIRRPANVGVAVVVGSGSQPSDQAPVADAPLKIRIARSDDEWNDELVIPASDQTVRIEAKNPPDQWAAVKATVSRRS